MRFRTDRNEYRNVTRIQINSIGMPKITIFPKNMWNRAHRKYVVPFMWADVIFSKKKIQQMALTFYKFFVFCFDYSILTNPLTATASPLHKFIIAPRTLTSNHFFLTPNFQNFEITRWIVVANCSFLSNHVLQIFRFSVLITHCTHFHWLRRQAPVTILQSRFWTAVAFEHFFCAFNFSKFPDNTLNGIMSACMLSAVWKRWHNSFKRMKKRGLTNGLNNKLRIHAGYIDNVFASLVPRTEVWWKTILEKDKTGFLPQFMSAYQSFQLYYVYHVSGAWCRISCCCCVDVNKTDSFL